MDTRAKLNPKRRSFILVEGPPRDSAEFYGKWLLAAGQAEVFWKKIQNERDYQDEEFFCHLPDFGRAAALMLTKFNACATTFLIDLNDFEGWDFSMMSGMGFFTEFRQYYRMSLPNDLTEDRVRKAVLALTRTDDDACYLHPEYLVNPVSFAKARAQQVWIEGSALINAET